MEETFEMVLRRVIACNQNQKALWTHALVDVDATKEMMYLFQLSFKKDFG